VTTLVVSLLIVAAGAALVAQVVWWLSGRPDSARVPPPLVVPIHPRFARQAQEPAIEPAAPTPAADPLPETQQQVAQFAPQPDTTQSTTLAALASPAPAIAPPHVSDELPAETVQFVRPTDDALQLLPARLEVVSGMAPRQVIRFVRVPGQPAEMILGREAASSPRHVTLASSTVSRRHARVTYADGRWLVTNLSRTNPVVVNDQALDEFEGARPLLDGDRIELGDVVLRFCTS
jgi:hypothetical protein